MSGAQRCAVADWSRRWPRNRGSNLVHSQLNSRRRRWVVNRIGRREDHRQRLHSSGQHGAGSRSVDESAGHSTRRRIQLSCAQRRAVGDRRRCRPGDGTVGLVHCQLDSRRGRRVVGRIGGSESHRQRLHSNPQHGTRSRRVEECASHSAGGRIQLSGAQWRAVGDRSRCCPGERSAGLVHCQLDCRRNRHVVGRVGGSESHRQRLHSSRQNSTRSRRVEEGSGQPTGGCIQLGAAQRRAIGDRRRCRPGNCGRSLVHN